MSSLIWLVVFVVLVGFVALSYNSLVQRRNQVKNAWSQIDVQLKRRIELIPKMAELGLGRIDLDGLPLLPQQTAFAQQGIDVVTSKEPQMRGVEQALALVRKAARHERGHHRQVGGVGQ